MFHLIEDVGQKKGHHEKKHEYWQTVGCRVVRCRLPYGDYVAMPTIAVDTKRSIYEIASNIDADHERFRNECIGAQKHGCQLVVLIENLDGVTSLEDLEGWRESYEHYRMREGKRRIEGRRLARAMRTMTRKYGVRWEFCTPNEAGRRVLEILGEAHG